METAKTYTAQIFVGLRHGYTNTIANLDVVRDICRDYVNQVGLCVTLTPTEFIYTDGGEPGAIVGLINYPRFPSTPEAIDAHATELARLMKESLHQNRVSIVGTRETVMI